MVDVALSVDRGPRAAAEARLSRAVSEPRRGKTAAMGQRQRSRRGRREDGRPGKALRRSRDFKAAFKRFQADQMTDHAAALTYYSLLSLFPALLFAVAVLGVFGQEALIDDTADYLQDAGAPPDDRRRGHRARSSPRSRSAAPRSPRSCSASRSRSTARRARSAPSGRALNRVWRVEEGRGFVAPQGSTTCCGRWSCSCS